MSSDINSIIQLGHDITSHKFYALATGTVLFYDYFLTLEDEVKYAWSGKKTWTFWLFIFNRYFPMTWQFWQLGVAYSPRSQLDTKICEKTSWYSLVMFVTCTLLAQVVLTIRIYAVTLKNLPLSIGFAIITACQLVLGVWMVTLAGVKGAQPQPPIPLDAYHLCVFVQPRTLEVAYTSISLFYDFLAFSLIIYLAKKSKAPGLRVPTILDTIAEDATWYFLVIFTSHFVLVLTLNLGRVTIQLLPGPGVLVYIPLMSSRIMLSLRKAAYSSQHVWSLMGPATTGTNLHSIKFFKPRKVTSEGEDSIPLGTYTGPSTVPSQT